ncbi:MAG: PadR family transcriptional regulator [Acidimicrobiales bacterium]
MHRAARGNVRAAILALLAEQKTSGGPPIHGYQIIQELSTRTGGAWRPSPGSIYPTLQLLEDEGLIESQSPEGKRLFQLTDAGQAEFERTKEARAPWEQVSDGFGESRIQLKVAARDTAVSLIWAARNATDEQRADILTLLGEFRERLYALVPEAAAEPDHEHSHGRGHVRRTGRNGNRPGAAGFGESETDDLDV